MFDLRKIFFKSGELECQTVRHLFCVHSLLNKYLPKSFSDMDLNKLHKLKDNKLLFREIVELINVYFLGDNAIQIWPFAFQR